MRLRIQPYGFSKSAKELERVLNATASGYTGNVRRLKAGPNSSYRPRPDDVVINWGSRTQRFDNRAYLNKPYCVGLAADKLNAFSQMDSEGVSVPLWTEHKDIVRQWLSQGKTVYARTKLSANSGKGIVIMRPNEYITPIPPYIKEIPNAPLYTVLTEADKEYRVHVFKDKDNTLTAIHAQEKRRREEGVDADELVRNHDNNWVFCIKDKDDQTKTVLEVLPDCAKRQAINAVASLGLDFGAVDVGYKSDTDTAYIYEVNTAPGLTGTTPKLYAKALAKLIGLDYSPET